MLSLVNAATVAFDLVRIPSGAQAAEVLLTALHAGPTELDTLDRLAGGRSADDRDRLVADRAVACAALSRGGPVPMAEALADLAGELLGVPSSVGTMPAAASSAARAVTTMPLCRGTDLVALFVEDVLGWTRTEPAADSTRLWPYAVEALLDSFIAALAAPALSTAQQDRLTAPLRRLTGTDAELAAPVGDLGPNHDAVAALLAVAAELQPERADVLAARHSVEPGWSTAMHRACWAVYLSGRIRPAAAAQFSLARTVARRPDRLQLVAGGAFQALSGAVHAQLVADLLDDESSSRLLAPTQSVD